VNLPKDQVLVVQYEVSSHSLVLVLVVGKGITTLTIMINLGTIDFETENYKLLFNTGAHQI
jgi:hypothetical protein